jgi:hypothetical protein
MRGLCTLMGQIRLANSCSADEFAAVNRNLEKLTFAFPPNDSVRSGDDDIESMEPFGQLVVQQRKLLNDREKLVSQIQALPGFDTFLKPPSFDILRSAACHGPVIRDRHGLAGPYGCTVRVVAATASGRDIAARAPPVPVPRVVQVFSHAQVILNLHTPSQIGGSLSDCPSLSTFSAMFHPHFLPGDFRIVLSFTSSHPPLTAFPHGSFWDPARHCVGWVRQEVVYCYTAGMFSLFLSCFC